MPQDRTSSDLLATLYAAPMSPELWPEFLSGLVGMLGLNASALIHTDLSCRTIDMYISCGIDPEIERLYAAGYNNHDVYRAGFVRLQGRSGGLLMGDQLCSFDQVKKTAFGEDILHRADTRLWYAVAMARTDNVVENISLFHPWNHDPPGNDKLALVRRIAPHVNNALRIRAQLARLEGLSRDLAVALDKADTAIVLFDHQGHCAFINGEAKRILDRRDGLLSADNRIVATDPNESAALLELIRRAVAGCQRKEQTGGEAVSITRQHGKPLQLRIAPFPCERLSLGSQFAAIALIGNPDKCGSVPLKTFQAAYGLTPAEAKIAVLLLQGRTVTEAAEANSVTRETIRSQVKSIFLKTGTRRQSELIALLSSVPGQIT